MKTNSPLAIFASLREKRGMVYARRAKAIDMAARRLYAVTLASLAVALAGCGTARPMPDFDSFAHRVTDNVVVLHWNCSRPEPGVVQVAGVANNPYYQTPIQNLGFRLFGVNAQGSDVSLAQGTAQAFLIYMNSPSPFTLDLNTQGTEVRYDLIYNYRLGQPPGGARALVAGGEQQNYARNVCAEMGP